MGMHAPVPQFLLDANVAGGLVGFFFFFKRERRVLNHLLWDFECSLLHKHSVRPIFSTAHGRFMLGSWICDPF